MKLVVGLLCLLYLLSPQLIQASCHKDLEFILRSEQWPLERLKQDSYLYAAKVKNGDENNWHKVEVPRPYGVLLVTDFFEKTFPLKLEQVPFGDEKVWVSGKQAFKVVEDDEILEFEILKNTILTIREL